MTGWGVSMVEVEGESGAAEQRKAWQAPTIDVLPFDETEAFGALFGAEAGDYS